MFFFLNDGFLLFPVQTAHLLLFFWPFKQYLFLRVEAVRGQLVFSRLFSAAVGNHKTRNAERSGVAEAPHEHFLTGLPALSYIAEYGHFVSGFSVSAFRYRGK